MPQLCGTLGIRLNQLDFLLFLNGGWRWLALLVLSSLAVPAAQAQILDDSTKILYGPKTTRLIYEDEVLRDSTEGIPLDTSLTRWSQTRFWFHDSTFQQDLGNVGTASRPLLYQPNIQLGARFGRNVFDKYARNAAAIPYYDSRSPYSFFRVLQSGEGEQVFEFSYSRSLGKNFSIGASFERIASNKTLAARSSRDGLVEHTNLLLFGRYQNDNERYHLVFNISNARHTSVEQGGIRRLAGENAPQDLFNYDQQQVYLANATNKEDRDQVHFTHSYRLLGRGLTVFHTFDAFRQYNSYNDRALVDTIRVVNRYTNGDTSITSVGQGILFYPRILRNTRATIDRAEFRQVENTVGLLGRTKAVEYRLYARYRAASLTSKTLSPNPDTLNLVTAIPKAFNQIFLGGRAAFNYRTIYAVEVAGEYKLFDESWLRATVRTGPLSGEVLLTSYAPTLTQQEFVGNHYEWHNVGANALPNTTATHFTGRIRQRLPGFAGHYFEASASLVNINNLVYYGPEGTPISDNIARQLLIGFARHHIKIGRVGFDNQATYTRGGDVGSLRIPSLVAYSRAYYESYIFGKALFSQVGAEVYYQSRFRAYDYSPSTQQFYIQDHFTIRNYPIVDVFFVADIKTVSVFLKMAYVNQGLGANGYYTTPYYTGYPRRFQFGIKWNFFN